MSGSTRRYAQRDSSEESTSSNLRLASDEQRGHSEDNADSSESNEHGANPSRTLSDVLRQVRVSHRQMELNFRSLHDDVRNTNQRLDDQRTDMNKRLDEQRADTNKRFDEHSEKFNKLVAHIRQLKAQ